MTTVRTLILSTSVVTFASCSMFNKGGENYDTADGGGYSTSDPYGVPGENYGEATPYQQVNPPADNPTYTPAAYEDQAPAAASYSAPASPSSAGTSHTVVRGDTLGGIARRYGVSTSSIKQANGMSSDVVVLGKNLVIPGSSGPVASAPAPSGGRSHTVVRGDSLSRIASQYGTTVAAIKQANNMKSDTVVLGSRLRIP